jgi:hypothetical protein
MTAPRDWHSEPEPADELRRPKDLHEEAGPLRLTLATLGGLIILGIVLYGLNRPHPQHEPNAQQTAQAPAPMPAQPSGSATTGAAPQDEKKANAPVGNQGKSEDKPQ